MAKPTRPAKKTTTEKQIIIQQEGKEHSHVFNKKEILEFIKTDEYLEYVEQKNQQGLAQDILTQLESISAKKSWLKVSKRSSFAGIRAIYGHYDPIDVSGTLADGGRLNIGGAQQQSQKGLFCKKKAGLYFADSLQTARLELSLPNAPHIVLPHFYKIEFKEKKEDLILFDFNHVLLELDNMLNLSTNISALCYTSPFAGSWGDQKIPAPSQIVGQWLRNQNLAHGIIFRSTKNTDGHNYFLFFEDNKETKIKLKATKILVPE